VELEYRPPYRQSFLRNTLRERVFTHVDIRPRPVNKPAKYPTITIVDRRETRVLFDLDRMVDTVRAWHPNSTSNVVDLATLSLRDQVQLSVDTDVLVAVHGAGLTHALWLPADAAVIEIRPPLFAGSFRGLAGLCGTRSTPRVPILYIQHLIRCEVKLLNPCRGDDSFYIITFASK
jgi:protein O-GlcNAc transferase